MVQHWRGGGSFVYVGKRESKKAVIIFFSQTFLSKFLNRI